MIKVGLGVVAKEELLFREFFYNLDVRVQKYAEFKNMLY